MSMRKHGLQVAAGLGLGVLWAATGQGDGLKLQGVEVVGAANSTRVVLDVEGAVTHRSFTLRDPERIVVDLVGAVNAVSSATQTFAEGPVARVRVSQFQSVPQPVTRVVADLRVPAGYGVEPQDEDLVLVVGADAATPTAATPTAAPVQEFADFAPVPVGAPGSESALAAAPAAAEATGSPASALEALLALQGEALQPVSVASAAATPVAVESSAAAHVEPVVEPQTVAATAMTAATGDVVPVEDTAPDAPPGGVELTPIRGSDRRINLDVQDADIHTVLRTLADYAGKNIIASREVEGSVSARLYDTPWQDALLSILKAHGFGYIEEEGIIRVGVLQKLRNEELEEAAADRKREDLLPIETQVVRLQFADASELKPSLTDMMSQRGKLQVDERTNALIVSDIPASVAKVAAMASDLDSRTPQVEIVSKLVDVGVEDSKNLGITWSGTVQPAGSPVPITGGVSVPTTNPAGALRIGTVQAWGQLDATIDALAKNRKANVVSNPTITTVNNREAKILVGQKIPLIVADQAGNAITQLTKIGIMMAVIPHINSDKTITLDLHTEVSELSSQATVQGGVIIQTSEADTRVLVDNTETAIIGGLVRDVESKTKTGIPVLMDIPLVGMLFRNTNVEKAKRELIIFVTPRLIEPGQRLRSN